MLAPGEPLWNWHVSRFEGCGDFGIELVDGWPSYIEQDVEGSMRNTRTDHENLDAPGHIGFWSYTVVAELGSGPGTSPIPIPGAVCAPAGCCCPARSLMERDSISVAADTATKTARCICAIVWRRVDLKLTAVSPSR